MLSTTEKQIRDILVMLGRTADLYVDLWPTDGSASFATTTARAITSAAETKTTKLLEFGKAMFGRLRPSVSLDEAGQPKVDFGIDGRSVSKSDLTEVLAAPQALAERSGKTVVVVFDEFQQIVDYEDDLAERHRDKRLLGKFVQRPNHQRSLAHPAFRIDKAASARSHRLRKIRQFGSPIAELAVPNNSAISEWIRQWILLAKLRNLRYALCVICAKMQARLGELEAGKRSFALETTLAGRSHRRRICQLTK